ncbi:MAG: DUF1877 family protein [Pseudomonadota bacterium]
MWTGSRGIAEGLEQRRMEAALASVPRAHWAEVGAGANTLGWIAAAVLAHLRDHALPDISKPEFLDLDKSWHILHWLLAGRAEPAGALLGGEAVGPCGGYGPVRLLRPAEVAAFAEVLAPLDVPGLLARADASAMHAAGIAFVASPGDDMIPIEIEEHIPRPKKFVAATVKKKRGLLVMLE